MKVSRVVCGGLIVLALSAVQSAAGDSVLRAPDGIRLILPYRDYPLAPTAAIASATYKVTVCTGTTIPFPLSPGRATHSFERTVTVNAPHSVDLMSASIVNALLVQALYVAWVNCDTQNIIKKSVYQGVAVKIFQDGQIAFETEDLNGDFTGYQFSYWHHRLAQRIEAEQRARAAAIAAVERAAFWKKVLLGFYLLAGITLVILFGRHVPKALAYIRYALSPHPANSLILRATRGARSRPVNGQALLAALRRKVSNPIEAKLSTRDMKKMTERVEGETEYLRASEELAQKTIDMELARVRFEELKKVQGRP